MPGAFAGMAEALRGGFAAVGPGVALEFHAFVPSGVLAREILAGAPADVYVSANRRFMAEVVAAGLIRAPRRLAGNRLCAIILPDRANRVRSLADLAVPATRLVTPQSETDPCGRYVAELWERAGMNEAMAAKVAGGTLIHSHGSGDLPGFLVDDRADAGVFYASEALALGDRVATVPFPVELDLHDRIVFWIGEVIRASDAHPAASAFVEFITGLVGQDLLLRHGFLPASAASA